MAVPSLLLALWHRMGHPGTRMASLAPVPVSPYFATGLLGYAAGIALTLAVAELWQAAQPALLFLVPSTVAPVVILACLRGEAGILWHPPPDAPEQGAKDAEP
jgi:signal peptide peptidase-like 3